MNFEVIRWKSFWCPLKWGLCLVLVLWKFILFHNQDHDLNAQHGFMLWIYGLREYFSPYHMLCPIFSPPNIHVVSIIPLNHLLSHAIWKIKLPVNEIRPQQILFRFGLKFQASAGWRHSLLLCNHPSSSLQALRLPTFLRRERFEALRADSEGRLWVWRAVLGWHIRLRWASMSVCVCLYGLLWTTVGPYFRKNGGQQRETNNLLVSFELCHELRIWRVSISTPESHSLAWKTLIRISTHITAA